MSILLGITERAVRKSISNYEHRSVKSVGGKRGTKYEIALESLSEQAQAKYNNQTPNPHYKEMLKFTGKQRKEADFKALIICQYHTSGLSVDEFIKKFNEDNPEDKINRHKLMRWQRKLKDDKGVLALIDKRGGYNRGKTSISEEVWDYFYSLYMTQQKRSVQRCWELTKKVFSNIPSISTFERKVRTIPEYVILEFREGENALKNKLPSMIRSRQDIESNSVWFSDHHLCDVIVLDERGKPIRPWLTVFFDARSNRVMSYITRSVEPNATVVKQSLRKGIEKNQVIPKEVYFDNGKDYKSKSFSEDYPISLVNQLGIKTIYATPYHGQAKTVERFFGTLEDRFGKLFDTYIGRNAQERPEQMKVPNKEIIKKAVHIDKFIELLDIYIDEYNNTSSRGIDMERKTPNQVYSENLSPQLISIDSDILKLLCGTFEERTIQPNGIQYLNNFYWNEALIPHLNKRVIVSYDSDDIESLYVFDTEYRAICIAKAKVLTPFRKTTEEDYKRAQKEKKAVRNFNKQHSPSRELSVHEVIARNQLTEKQYEEQKPLQAESVTEQLPKVFENTEAFKKKEVNRSRHARRENSISNALTMEFESKKIGG